MKKIAVGDLGEFWYGDYKEPFVQLEGAVPGYPQGVVLKADDGKLLCAYCGRTYDNLGNHTGRTHGLSAAAYKREVGLLQKSALVSERGRLNAIRSGLKGGAGRIREHLASCASPRENPGNVGHNPRRTPEYLNKSGRCYAQVLAVASTLMRQQGRVTHKALARRGITAAIVRSHFGSVEGLRLLVGDGRNVGTPYTEAQLIGVIRSFAAEYGRTPTHSDLRRVGAPSPSAFNKVFGTYTQACIKAGVPPYRFQPTPQSEAAILNAYALMGSVSKVASAQGIRPSWVRKTLDQYGIPTFTGWGRDIERRAARGLAAEIAQRLAGADATESAA